MRVVRVFIISVLFLMSAQTFAADGTESPMSRRMSLHVAGGLLTTSGVYGAVALAGIELPVGAGNPLRLGLESGALLGSGTGIPVLLSFVLRSDELTRGISPFLGISMGPVFCSGGGALGAGDAIKLAMFLRAGARYPLGSLFDAMPELWIGGLTGVFLMAPVLKVAIYL